MEIHGTKVYLSIAEQLDSDYPSPIDITTFPLHEERTKADAELDRFESMKMADDTDLTHAERASLPADLDRAFKKSHITRQIGKLTATHSLVYGDPSSKQ